MKKRIFAVLAAGVVAGTAWGQTLLGSLEIRGVQTLLETAGRVTAGTEVAGVEGMAPALLQQLLGVDLLSLTDPRRTVRADFYWEASDELGVRLSLPVADAEAFFRRLGMTWEEEEIEDEAGAGCRLFAAPDESGLSGAKLQFRGQGNRVLVTMALDEGESTATTFERLHRGEGPAVEAAGVVAFGTGLLEELKPFAEEMGMEGIQLDAFQSASVGVGLEGGEKVAIDLVESVGDLLLPYMPKGAVAADAHLVNLPNALMAAVDKVETPCPWIREQLMGLLSDGDEERAEMLRQRQEFVERFAEEFRGDIGIALLPCDARAERPLPRMVAYLTPKDAEAARAWVRENAPKTWAAMAKAIDAEEQLKEGEDALEVTLSGEREVAGSAVDTYQIVLPDVPANEEVREKMGWEMPMTVGSVELAWLGNGALVISTLGASELDEILERRAAGRLSTLGSRGDYAEMFGGHEEAGMGYLNLFQLVPMILDYAKAWGMEDEDLAEIQPMLAALPSGKGTLAWRCGQIGERTWRFGLRMKLADVRKMVEAAQTLSALSEGGDEDDVDIDFELDEDEELDFDEEE